jgi:hypothetical protein
MNRQLARLAIAWVAIAVATWLIPASIHIVGWPAAGPVRVALFQSLPRLWAALAIVAASFALVAGLLSRRAPNAIETLAVVTAPADVLLLWVVPFTPWLPDHAPLLLILAGPLRWGVAALAAVGVLWSAVRELGDSRASELAEWSSVRVPRLMVFTITLAIYLACGLRQAKVGPAGDEPHYLIITHSLLVDHDLAIENNHARQDYRNFFSGSLRPDFLQRGKNEVIYSIHAPGLPALLVPGYAAAGYRGAVVVMCVVAALAALGVFDLAVLVAGQAAGVLTWMAVCLTVPMVPHAWLIYPETFAFLIVASTVRWLWVPLPERILTWLWRGVVLALLPWLHTKFVVILAVLAGALVARLRTRPKEAFAFIAPLAIGGAAWLWSFYLMYGVFDPQAPYGAYTALYVLNANIPRSLLGLLFDQKFGLLVYAPVYGLAAVGGWLMMRRREGRFFGLTLLAGACAFSISSARLYMWWGGSSAPARFLVPILPMLAPMVAVAIGASRGAFSRAAVGLTLITSLTIAAAGAAEPRQLLLFSAPHGYANMLDAIQGSSAATFLSPTFTDENWVRPLGALFPWAIGALAASLVGITVASRWRGRLAAYATAQFVVITFAFTTGIVAGVPAPSARAVVALRGQQELMLALAAPGLRGFDYANRKKLDEATLMRLAVIVTHPETSAADLDARHLAGPFVLPSGQFEARIWFDGVHSHPGEAFVAASDRGQLRVAGGPLGNPTTLRFELPVPFGVWIGLSDQESARAVRQVEVVPERILPSSERPDVDVRAIDPLGDRGRDDVSPPDLLYVDDETYPEGGVFWTRDTHKGSVLVTAVGGSTVLLTLHVGPVAGRVRIAAGGKDLSTVLKANETRSIEVGVPAGTTMLPISVQAASAFRPADVDPTSTDLRRLGCQVRVEIQTKGERLQ